MHFCTLDASKMRLWSGLRLEPRWGSLQRSFRPASWWGKSSQKSYPARSAFGSSGLKTQLLGLAALGKWFPVVGEIDAPATVVTPIQHQCSTKPFYILNTVFFSACRLSPHFPVLHLPPLLFCVVLLPVPQSSVSHCLSRFLASRGHCCC